MALKLDSERQALVDGTTEAETHRRLVQERIDKKQQELEEANAKLEQRDNELE